ncbi:MAG TPA: 6-phosphofructokinase, partial [Bryobacteraceae bacterium]
MIRVNAAIAHGGGPTSVLNASLAAVIETCRRHTEIQTLQGARSGVEGLLSADFVDLLEIDPQTVSAVAGWTGSAIGSSRRRLTEAEVERIVGIFRERDIRWFFYTGGNGSMQTALEIGRHARAAGWDLQVIGIPKTIDNDLPVTDHT